MDSASTSPLPEYEDQNALLDALRSTTASAMLYLQVVVKEATIPSARETSPISIAEAMTMGIPVIATDVGGVRELVGDGGHVIGLDDQQAFDDRLVELLADAKSQEVLSKAARARAESFRADVVAARVHGVYLTALAQGAGRTASPYHKSPSAAPASCAFAIGTMDVS